MARCAGCRAMMKKLGPSHIYCMKAKCRAKEFERRRETVWKSYYENQARREERGQRDAALRIARDDDVLGTSLPAPVRHATAFARAVESVDDPVLAEIVAEQIEDQRRGHWAGKPWERSLDAPVNGDGSTLLDLLYGDVDEDEDDTVVRHFGYAAWKRLGSPDAWVEPLLDRIDRELGRVA
jgi:hypothetical protein